MAIDFTLTPEQVELKSAARKFAREVLADVRGATDALPTAEERFLATRPAYEAMVAAGFLRKCIPAPAGGEGNGLVDMAIMAEEFYSVNASVTLTMLGTVLGLLPVLIGGTPEQCGRFPGAVPAKTRRAACRLLLDRTGRQCQCRFATAGRRCAHDRAPRR